jgi:hypothetical protein
MELSGPFWARNGTDKVDIIPPAMTKAAINKMKTLFKQKPGTKFNEGLSKMLNWNTAFYGAGNWTRQNVGEKYLESFFKCIFGDLWNKQSDLSC